MNCELVVKQLPLMLYGELSFDEEETLQQHLENCASCRSGLEKTRQLHRILDASEQEFPLESLTAARRKLRVSLAAIRESEAERGAGQFRASWLAQSLARWNGLWKPALVFGAMTVAFVAGRQMPANTPSGFLPNGPAGPVASRVRFVQPEESGRVQIVVEEVRQKVLEGGLHDDAIRSLLVSATREAHDPGVRVETMDLLKTQSASTEVRRALLSALQHDPNPGVRLKALEGLRVSASDTESRRVLAQVLLTDENPGVRTQAIDLLTQQRGPEMVGVLQELVSREGNDYVRLKCQKVLREMNASVETF
ncbi:MAG: HEAT repeat domain-containing protein [Bryobacteraceae bacterium]|nr:HEAT repeat domain-containing protein [Bryobacteraceae bacterium]